MSETEKKEQTAEETVEAEQTAEASKPKKTAKKKKTDEFEKKYNELNDTYLRMLAEYDNYRKRTQKEKEGMYADGIVKSVSAMLPVIDNLERALAAETADADFKNGVELIYKQFLTTLDTLSVTEIECIGCPFDPKMHNAIMHVDDEQFGENEVIEVFQKGYKYKEDTVVRHAVVKVAN